MAKFFPSVRSRDGWTQVFPLRMYTSIEAEPGFYLEWTPTGAEMYGQCGGYVAAKQLQDCIEAWKINLSKNPKLQQTAPEMYMYGHPKTTVVTTDSNRQAV